MLSGTSGAGLAKFQATSPSASADSVTWRTAGRGCVDRRAQPAREADRGGGDRLRVAGDEPRGGWHRARHPLVLGLGRLRHGLHVEQDRRDVDAGDAVDERVVGLREQREALALQPLHQPQLPERLRAVELLGELPRHHVLQLLLGAGRGQRRVADVVLEVERRVVDPERAPRLQGRDGELLAEAGDEVEAAADVLDQVVVARRRTLEDQHPADVHVARIGLVAEKRGIDRTEAIHVALGHA